MAVVVFDSDVLIGFLNAADAHHADAVALMRESFTPGTRRMLSAVNYSEILIGPIKAGKRARDHVDAMLGSFSIEIMMVDGAVARRAAAVRARTDLKLPDAYALATAIHVEHNGTTTFASRASTRPCCARTPSYIRTDVTSHCELRGGVVRLHRCRQLSQSHARLEPGPAEPASSRPVESLRARPRPSQ